MQHGSNFQRIFPKAMSLLLPALQIAGAIGCGVGSWWSYRQGSQHSALQVAELRRQQNAVKQMRVLSIPTDQKRDQGSPFLHEHHVSPALFSRVLGLVWFGLKPIY